MKRNMCAPIPTGVSVLDVQYVTGWRETHLRTAFLVSSCFCGSLLPINHNSFFFSPNLWNHDRYNQSTVQFLLRVQWVWKCSCHVVSACLSVCLNVGYLCFVAGSKQNSSARRMCCLYWRNLPVWLQRVSHQCTHEGERDYSVGSCGKEGKAGVIYDITVMLLSQRRTNNH